MKIIVGYGFPKERTSSMSLYPSAVDSSPGSGLVMADARQWTQDRRHDLVVSQKTSTGLLEKFMPMSLSRIEQVHYSIRMVNMTLDIL